MRPSAGGPREAVVNRSRVDPTASSGEINEQVAAVEESDGVYAIDRETLAELEPDLIVTQGAVTCVPSTMWWSLRLSRNWGWTPTC